MLNFLKMDIYRGLRSAKAWVILLIAALNIYISMYLNRLELNVSDQNNLVEYSVGGNDTGENKNREGIITTGDLFRAEIKNSNLLILLTIYCFMFVNSESKTGFIKNIAGQLPNRSKLVISKLITNGLYAGLLLGFSLIITIIGQILLLGDSELTGLKGIVPFIGTQWILHVAFASIITCIIALFHNTIISLLIGLFLASGLFEAIYFYVVMLVNQSMSRGNTFLLINYLVDGNIRHLPLAFHPIIYIQALLVAVAFLLATASISMFVIRKRDIN